MTKHHEIFEHTADIGVAASAGSLGELFEALAEGTAAVICDPAAVRATELRRLEIIEDEADLEGLVVDCLWLVVSLIEEDRFLVRSVRTAAVNASRVELELSGEPYDPDRHELLREVKAVTWHQLQVKERDGAWEARVILDL